MSVTLKLFTILSFNILFFTAKAQENNSAKTFYEEANGYYDHYKEGKAFNLMEKSSNLGYLPAHQKLSLWYSIKYSRGDRKNMFKYMLRAAEAGDSVAMQTVANYYQKGDGTDINLIAAAQWYEKAIAHENKDALMAFAKFYLNKEAGNSPEDAKFWFKKIADKDPDAWEAKTYYYFLSNNLQAAYDLGAKYEDPKIRTEERKIIAWQIYMILRNLGDAKGTYLFARVEYSTEDRIKDLELAMQRGYPVPESEYEGAKEHWAFLKSQPIRSYSNTSASGNSISSAERKKPCPICSGTGKCIDRYTSESRNYNDKTITFTDHTTTRNCIRCNGTGYIIY
jgi:TPR repeat protein